ncbi:MAG TPA: hypothetical protein VFQ60_04460, partial [Patescibacteria group bacterium]|nr:hypothetical protein [Patescibacteria group bacterium]
DYSESRAEMIDKEVDRLMSEGLDSALKIIRDHRDAMDRVVSHLLEKETIERDEFETIVGIPPANPRNAIPQASTGSALGHQS